MRTIFWHCRLRVLPLVSLAVICVLAMAGTAFADPPGTCTMGTSYTTGLALTVDGAAQAMTAGGAFGDYGDTLPCQRQWPG